MDTIATDSLKLQQIIDEEWESGLQYNPLLATHAGDHRFNDRLPSVSEADFEKRKSRLCDFQERLLTINRSALSADEQLNYDMLSQLLDAEIGELEFKMYRMPICKMYGFHQELAELPEVYTPFNTHKDYQNYIHRLNAFKDYIHDYIDVMRIGVQDGQTVSKTAVESVDDQVKSHCVDDAMAGVFFAPFRKFPASIEETAQKKLLEHGLKAIEECVIPSYKDLFTFIRDEYIKNSRDTFGIMHLPRGEELYQHRIRFYTSLDLSAESIHRIGIEEINRIKDEMHEIIGTTGFNGSLKDFIEYLRTSPRFYASTPEALLKEISFVLKRIDGELPRLFKRLPRMPYGIKEIPAHHAAGTSAAYYHRPAGDGSRAGFYYINTHDLKSRPLYDIEALSLHEAVPGHHLQISLQQELNHLPLFRKFSNCIAFTEGWALYAERLGSEIGFYTDPYSNFGRLCSEMFRACRLVIDTGIHAFNWSREQSITFMADHTALSIHDICTEVDRYSAWPGQALAYKMGEIKIRELRSRAEQELGVNFDIRDFHDIILGNGAVTLTILEQLVNNWIAQQKVMNCE